MKITRSQLRKLIKEMAWDPSSSETPHPHFKHDTPEDYEKFLQSSIKFVKVQKFKNCKKT